MIFSNKLINIILFIGLIILLIACVYLGYSTLSIREGFDTSTTAPGTTAPSTTAPRTTTPSISTYPNGQIMTQDDINMENAYQMLDSTYQHNPSTTTTSKSGFANLGANSQVIAPDQTVAAKIKNDTKNVEKIAIGFITVLILIFLIAVIAYVKNAKSS